jgi:hypothetical protein
MQILTRGQQTHHLALGDLDTDIVVSRSVVTWPERAASGRTDAGWVYMHKNSRASAILI